MRESTAWAIEGKSTDARERARDEEKDRERESCVLQAVVKDSAASVKERKSTRASERERGILDEISAWSRLLCEIAQRL